MPVDPWLFVDIQEKDYFVIISVCMAGCGD